MTPVGTIGLTGGIGSGKSTVARLLAQHGALIVDTDAIARELTQSTGAAMPALVQAFGPSVAAADGSLDRDRMRRLAFEEPAAKARLEAVLHPLIGEQAALQAAKAGSRPVVFDVPLLAESRHWRQRVQRVLVIDCSEATQTLRVLQRPGWDEAAVRRVIAQQAPRAVRRAIADAIIHNDALSLPELALHVDCLWALWNNRPQ